jgi:hypothetical protein
MESFQQSGLKTSLPNREHRRKKRRGLHGAPAFAECAESRDESTLANAIASEMEPFRSSLTRTAAAAEYASEEGRETRE